MIQVTFEVYERCSLVYMIICSAVYVILDTPFIIQVTLQYGIFLPVTWHGDRLINILR